MSWRDSSEAEVLCVRSAPAGLAAVLRRLEVVAQQLAVLQLDLESNERERADLVARWNQLVSEEDRLAAKQRRLLGEGPDQ